jgi:hypothetical protein
MSKVDICDRLRLAPANLIGTDDEERYWVCHDAAMEIERLRLTDAEREAIGLARSVFDDYKMSRIHNVADEVLERLLDRTKR